MDETESGPTIVASGGEMGPIYEMTPFNIKFVGENVSSVISMKILKFKTNIGVDVDTEKATIKGMYEDSFTFKNNLFYMLNGVSKQASKFAEVDAESSDIYLWIPPKAPVIFEYIVEMEYETEGEEGSGTIKDTLTQTLSHEVKSNYTYFAKQVRKLIDIRREANYGRDEL